MLVANIFRRVLVPCVVAKNKSMKMVRPKTDNIWHVELDYYNSYFISKFLLLLLLLSPYHHYYLIILFYNYFIFHTINYMHDFFPLQNKCLLTWKKNHLHATLQLENMVFKPRTILRLLCLNYIIGVSPTPSIILWIYFPNNFN